VVMKSTNEDLHTWVLGTDMRLDVPSRQTSGPGPFSGGIHR
jgi:hypothetical protein